MTSVLFTQLFLAMLILKTIVESILDKRNMDYISLHRNSVPHKFIDQISLQDHQRAADYSILKIKTSQYFHFFELLILLFWTMLGGLEAIYQFALVSTHSVMATSLCFLLLFSFISLILSLPRSLYFTFVIEEKFGFNKTTPKTFITDLLKSMALTILLGGPIVCGLLLIMEKLGTNWWIYAFLFLTIVQLLLIFIYPTFIAPIFNKFTPLDNAEIKNRIHALMEKCGFKASGLFVMDASRRSGHGNAYFTGFGKSKRIVFFDTLLSTLTPEEIEAVLAHELGHMKKKHILKGLIKGIVFSFITFYILGILKDNTHFLIGHGVHSINNALSLVLFSMVFGIYTFFLTPISAFVSRKYEYEADQFASEYSSAQKLISALVKMYKDNASSLTPDPLYSKFYFSHPPALERVQFLEKLATNQVKEM